MNVHRTLRIAAAAALAAALVSAPAAIPAADDEESQYGTELYKEMVAQREVVATSPLYDVLRPIGNAIARAAQARYGRPIRFYIVHEPQANAFAAPGGNVYVVDGLFYMAHNTDELAGVLCHETSHLIYHDSMDKMKRDQAAERGEIGATILLGPRAGLALGALAQLGAQRFSRQVEERADLAGADTCVAAGYNPWGLVWLFRTFQQADLQQPPEFLSDHPNDAHRIAALQEHFRADPGTFGRFRDDVKTATPLRVPQNEAEGFVR